MSLSAFIGTRLLVVACICSAAFACPARPDNDDVRKELEAAYAKRDKAFKDKDGALIKSFEADDYIQKTKDGTVADRAIVDPQTDQLLSIVKEIRILTTTVDKVTPGKEPNQYLAEVSSKGDFTIAGGDGALHQVVASAKLRDTWIKTKDGWKIKYHEELESATMLDGKPIE